MKRIVILLLTALSFWTSKINGQITLDAILDSTTMGVGIGLGGNFYTTELGPNETKYVFLDTTSNTFSLLNMDFTPFMTGIAVPEPFISASSGKQPIYVTRTLFDCDSSTIEYAYEDPVNCYETFWVMRTDGTILLQVDSAFGPFCLGGCLGLSDITRPIRNTSDGAKLFLMKCNSNFSLHVYSLCGTLPTDIFDFTEAQTSFVKIFPNPTANTLTFQVSQPDNLNEYELVLLDNSGKEIRRQKLIGLVDNYTIDVSEFSGGTYFYSLCTKTKARQTGKFIVVK